MPLLQPLDDPAAVFQEDRLRDISLAGGSIEPPRQRRGIPIRGIVKRQFAIGIDALPDNVIAIDIHLECVGALGEGKAWKVGVYLPKIPAADINERFGIGDLQLPFAFDGKPRHVDRGAPFPRAIE